MPDVTPGGNCTGMCTRPKASSHELEIGNARHNYLVNLLRWCFQFVSATFECLKAGRIWLNRS